ncbi:MAG TPA: hypothetical protein VEC13_00640 [Candidatus Paceibacterota bacterium]|nr:hypothetical protein [Candidatus Paceibacterota bacterium]
MASRTLPKPPHHSTRSRGDYNLVAVARNNRHRKPTRAVRVAVGRDNLVHAIAAVEPTRPMTRSAPRLPFRPRHALRP